MWKIIQMATPYILALIVLSQIIIPLMFDTQLFWLFRKSPEKKKVSKGIVKSQLEETKEVVANAKLKVKDVQERVDNKYKEAEKLKSEADNLL